MGLPNVGVPTTLNNADCHVTLQAVPAVFSRPLSGIIDPDQ